MGDQGLTADLDRDRLIRIAGLLASDKMGERAAAAAKASDMLRRAGMTWEDALRPVPGPLTVVLLPADTSKQEAEISSLRAALAASEATRRRLVETLAAERNIFWAKADC